MRYVSKRLVAVIFSVLVFGALGAFAGSLTPPGSVVSTMYSLSELYNSVAGTFNSSAVVADRNGNLLQNLKYIQANLPVSVWASGSNNIWNLNSGNVGIGTANVDTKFELAGTASISGNLIVGPASVINIASSNGQYQISGSTVLHNKGNFGIFAGVGAGVVNAGNYNSGVGYYALNRNTSGYDNTAVGNQALGFNTIGTDNTAVGHATLVLNSSGIGSTAVGSYALYQSTGSYNTAIGYNAMFDPATGTYNTAVGAFALRRNTSGYNNSAFGENSLGANTGGSYNTAMGGEALPSNTTGSYNVATGYRAMWYNQTGHRNVAVGNEALNYGSSGTDSVGVGYQAGYWAGASNNIFIGSSADVLGISKYGLITNSIVIGTNAHTTRSRQLIVGSDNGTNYLTEGYFGSGVSTSSPQAFRMNATSGYGANVIGANLTLAAGMGTGNALGGSLYFQTASASAYATPGTYPAGNPLSTRMAITPDGHVGIGTTSPSALLHISSASDGNIFRLQDSNGTCDHNPGAGSEVVTCSSDERLKADIADYGNARSYLSGFHIRSYNLKVDGSPMIGIIAQELLQTHPELVSSGSNGYLMVQQPNPWLLVKGIQELTASSLMLDALISRSPISSASEGPLARLVHNVLLYIADVFGVTIENRRIITPELCVGSACITQQQFIQMIQTSGQTPLSLPSPSPSVSVTP